MGVDRRVAEQHEDWLNLTNPEPPWFAVPAANRAFPNGLEPTRGEVRAEHKLRWLGENGAGGARDADDRTEYVEWLLRDVLEWDSDYLTGDDLPDTFTAGVTRHDTTVTPSGVYAPATPEPVGIATTTAIRPEAEPAFLVFTLPAGTNPATRPRDDTWPATWIQRAALACRHYSVPIALVTDGDYLTLVHARPNVTTGWGTWRASAFTAEPVLFDSFRSLLHARRFTAVADSDTPAALLAESFASQADVTKTLGSQVRKAVELLINAISRANLDRDGTILTGVQPHEVYEAAVTVLMRIVFLLVAEENGLLPVDHPAYQHLYAVRALRQELEEGRFTNPEALETRSAAWHRLLATSRAVYGGVRHHDLIVPAYGGTLFDPDRFPFLEGRRPGEEWANEPGAPIPITDLDVLAILDALLVLRFRSAAGVTDTRRLSYRQVDVEQIGHIYERLLDHDALAADGPVLGLRGRDGNEPEVPLADIEALNLQGDKTLIKALSDKKGPYQVGTARQVTRWLEEEVTQQLRAELLLVCRNDQDLARRIEPFATLLRDDLQGRPVVFLAGAVYMTETSRRGDSGTAYTTRELADEVVEHALAPLCYSPGPQDTPDNNVWQIRPSEEILGLKVCDPAVGSGAILVAACRYLAERLIEAWRAEGDPQAAEIATAADDPNRLHVVVNARRLVAERCCYGVDRNPMAVEMAKMSMWLTTVAKDRPFTFLDHALKAGDSLLGIWDIEQLRYLHFDPSAGRQRDIPIAGFTPGGDAWLTIDLLIDEAVNLRHDVQDSPTRNLIDVEHKAAENLESEALLGVLGAVADLVSGAALATAGSGDPSAALSQAIEADLELISDLIASIGKAGEQEALAAARNRAALRLNDGRPEGAPMREPLHWPIAFPEVFASNGGFDVMVGNPPFIDGRAISGSMGDGFRALLVRWTAGGTRGAADVVAYFFLSAARVARSMGFLATNTLGQGDTSEVGLAQLIDRGRFIHRAVSSTKWPGGETVEISKCWLHSGVWRGLVVLDGRPVRGIDETLYQTPRSGWRKERLRAYASDSFKGSNLNGIGFALNEDEGLELLSMEPRHAEVLSRYLNGQDLNQQVPPIGRRWVINFRDWPSTRAETFPKLLEIVRERVKPGRDALPDYKKRVREHWWQFEFPASAMYQAIANFRRWLCVAVVSKTCMPVFVEPGQTVSQDVIVFGYDDDFHFGVLASGFHYRWVQRFASTMRTDTRYAPTDVFETFPQPDYDQAVAQAAKALDEFRASLMAVNEQGLTDTYNRVHDPAETDPEILRLRQLHVELDVAVRDAYGWTDLALDHGFREVRGQGLRLTFSPEVADEILDRLLELNRDRYQAEVAAGLHRSIAAKHAKTQMGGQVAMYDDEADPDDDERDEE